MRRMIVPFLWVPLVLCGASAAGGQSPPSLHAGVALAVFADFPEPFLPEYCEQGAMGAVGSVGRAVSSRVSLEFQAAVSGGRGGMTCAIPGRPAPQPGSTFDERTFDDRIEGMSFLTTIVAVVGELTPEASSSVRGRVGVGRLWGKGLGMWSLGMGYRFDLGAGRMVFGVERWSFAVPFVQERILVGSEGEWLVQSSEDRELAEHPFLIRLRYEVGIP